MDRKTIAFIGGGNMGEAIISKMVSSDWKGTDIHVIDHNEEKLEHLASAYGVHTHKEPGSWLAEIDAVVLAVKPQQLPDAINASKEWIEDALVISMLPAFELKTWRP